MIGCRIQFAPEILIMNSNGNRISTPQLGPSVVSPAKSARVSNNEAHAPWTGRRDRLVHPAGRHLVWRGFHTEGLALRSPGAAVLLCTVRRERLCSDTHAGAVDGASRKMHSSARFLSSTATHGEQQRPSGLPSQDRFCCISASIATVVTREPARSGRFTPATCTVAAGAGDAPPAQPIALHSGDSLHTS